MRKKRGKEGRRGCASASHWPAFQGQRPQRRPLLLLASSGSLYKHSARRRIDNKHPQFLQNAKTASADSGSPGIPGGRFFAFFQGCEQVEDGGGLNGWWQAGQIRGQRGAARLLCLAPACIGAGTTPPACPPTLPLLNNQPDRRSTRHGQPAMFVLARPLWPALFTCLPLAATLAQAQPAWPRWGQ